MDVNRRGNPVDRPTYRSKNQKRKGLATESEQKNKMVIKTRCY